MGERSIKNKTIMKRLCGMVSLMLCIRIGAYTQEPQTSEAADRSHDVPVRISAFKIVSQYYGLPLSVRFGWFYRNGDFSLFPNTGFSFSVTDTPVLNASAGFALQKNAFFCNAYAAYDMLPFTMHKTGAEQIVYGTGALGFTLPRIKITFPLFAGRQRKTEITDNPAASAPEHSIVTGLSAGVKLDFFLADLGFFKSFGAMSLRYHWIPQAAFHYYTFTADIPAIFRLYYTDLAFMYSLFHTSAVQYGNTAPRRRYEIGTPQSAVTGRSSFKPLPKYTDIHLFSSEFRWYPARITAQTNGFFLSLFADAGVGISERQKRALLLEFGGGLGYNLYDSVPLTFQAGVNQNMQPVFYLSVVSRLSERP